MRRTTSWLLCGLLSLPALASAATIDVSAPAGPFAVGTNVTFDITGSGFADGIDGGEFGATWSSNLQYVGISFANPPWEPDETYYDDSNAASGSLDYAGVFTFGSPRGMGGAEFGIASLTFLATGEGAATLTLVPTLGWFLGSGDPIEDVTYAYTSVDVGAPVPLPAAAWLLASGIAALAGTARRRRPVR